MSIFDVALFATAFTTLTVIMDPVGTVPIFLGLTSRYSQHQQRRAAIQATSVSFGVILTFAILGGQILRLLNISMEALQLSGGVLLFLGVGSYHQKRLALLPFEEITQVVIREALAPLDRQAVSFADHAIEG